MRTLPPDDHARLVDAAHSRAAQLRREAIDDFWNAGAKVCGGVLRSTRRLLAALARHVQWRRAR